MSKTRLSVNINKFATLRNSRGGNNPDVVQAAIHAESFGAQGITVHPRPDERHIRYADVRELKKVVKTEFNIEGNPMEKKFMDLVVEVLPHQVTLVPDTRSALTSNQGWDTIGHANYLNEIIAEFKKYGIRTSLFIDPDFNKIEGAKKVGADRIELYTEAYAKQYHANKVKAITPYRKAAIFANSIGMGINAGHDLDQENLKYFQENIPDLLEVSIGHALICDSLYLGFEKAIQNYLNCLR
ncbi:MAG: pyridoxine 5'-phosphate synthase [Bacteroidetes bacterium]|nr:pyridoxine 5'-phosphate synthase [Bacteroidota bacterium]